MAGAVAALVAVGASGASAHDCFIPMYTLNAPQSANWYVLTARDAAADPDIAGFTTCDAGAEAGYAALREAGLPVGIRIFGKMTIGEGNNYHGEAPDGSTGSGQGAANNPNGANGVGLEYFDAGSTLPFQMLATFIGAAGAVDCSA